MSASTIFFKVLGSIGILALYAMYVVMTKPFPWGAGMMPEPVIQQEYIGWILFSIICLCAALGSVVLIWRLK